MGDIPEFTTRPELAGTFGMVASTHWLASAAGMAVLERGGNAFDAAVAAGLVLQVTEPHLNGLGGEVPVIAHHAGRAETFVLCGQGSAPAAATLEAFGDLGLDLVPGSGLLAACVPGAFGAWMVLLREYGTLRLRDVMDYAIGYAARGYPVLPAISWGIASVAELFRDHWPSSAEVYLPGGTVPAPGSRFANPALAVTYQRILDEAEAASGDRDEQIEAARRVYYEGFVAEAIAAYVASAEVMDVTGRPHRGLLSYADMSAWRPRLEEPLTYDYHGLTVCKTRPWGQGPVFAQQLALLEGFDLSGMGPASADYIHTVTECAKLAFADREAWYGDPDFTDVPVKALLSAEYADARRGLVGPQASAELRPGAPDGRAPRLPDFITRSFQAGGEGDASVAPSLDVEPPAPLLDPGTGEPTLRTSGPGGAAASSYRAGDTCHLDVADRFGNLVSATPSGGWLQSSPVIPGLGFCLGTRAQMFTLTPGLPATLAPGKRPRTTLTPSLALKDREPYLAFGTPGGDQQDQWSLLFFLNHVLAGMNLQQAIDFPSFHSAHMPSSFYPRQAQPRVLDVESRVGTAVVEDLRRRGHLVNVRPAWSLGRVSAVARRDGMLYAAANPRGMQGYAVGRLSRRRRIPSAISKSASHPLTGRVGGGLLGGRGGFKAVFPDSFFDLHPRGVGELDELQSSDPRRIGPYWLEGRLGSGGMGRVYLGRSPGGRNVAIKVIRAELAENADFRARFAREASAARKVSGIFTAPVVDADLDGPIPWLATSYIAGPSLSDAIAERGPMPAALVLRLAAGLAEGLAAIHAAGVVHRDLKPANVLLAEDGPRLIDFGISRSMDTISLTRTGMVVGSPGFMSPEQAEGRPVGPASDVFSLGAVLTFAATGEGPFGEGSTVALLYRVVTSEPHTQAVPAEIRPVIEHCLAKDPRQRPTAAQLLAQLSTADVVADPAREGTTRKSAVPDAGRRATNGAPGPVPGPAYPATERAVTPPPSRGGARSGGPTNPPSESQRAHEGHATEGERQWAGSAAEPEPRRGGLVADPEPRRAAGPQRRGTGRRGALIAAVAVVVLAAVGAVVFLAGKGKPTTTANAGNVAGASSSVKSPAPSPSVSPSSSSPSQPPGTAAMATLASYLRQSAAVRPTVQAAISNVQNCSEDPSTAAATIQQAITTRQGILQGLQTLSVSGLPNGTQLVSALTTAMQNSLNADTDYHAWMADLVSSGNTCGSNPNQDSNYVNGGTASSDATTSKNAFLSLWNPMAPTYGQQTYTATSF
jgi:gamma-glutamyltranspeptidase / glutathione hydrolase